MAALSWKSTKVRSSPPNSNAVTVTPFLSQTQHNVVILLEILSCTFVPKLSKIHVPWKHSLETALMRNGTIQLSNGVTVTLFLNQSLLNFKVFLEVISSTSLFSFVIPRSISVENLSKIRQETKKLQKMGKDVISKNSSIFFRFSCVSSF